VLEPCGVSQKLAPGGCAAASPDSCGPRVHPLGVRAGAPGPQAAQYFPHLDELSKNWRLWARKIHPPNHAERRQGAKRSEFHRKE